VVGGRWSVDKAVAALFIFNDRASFFSRQLYLLTTDHRPLTTDLPELSLSARRNPGMAREFPPFAMCLK
jgi:hypothetical protein